jgi:hypothetical protein
MRAKKRTKNLLKRCIALPLCITRKLPVVEIPFEHNQCAPLQPPQRLLRPFQPLLDHPLVLAPVRPKVDGARRVSTAEGEVGGELELAGVDVGLEASSEGAEGGGVRVGEGREKGGGGEEGGDDPAWKMRRNGREG